MHFSSFRHSCVYVLSKIRFRSNHLLGTIFQFECIVLGFKLVLLKRITSRMLRGKLVKALLPDDVKLLLRFGTNDTGILKEIYVENIYEKHHHPKSGDIVFDVGSHIGIFTLKASKLVGSTGFVYAFEPEPENFMLLKRNVGLNKASNIKIFSKAVSSRNGMLQLFIDPSNTGGSSVQYGTGRTSGIRVSSVTLDHIIQKHNIQEVNLLKLDVEGHELEILRGATHFLNICKQIAMETHERVGGPSNAQITEELRKHAFTIELVHDSDENDIIYGWR